MSHAHDPVRGAWLSAMSATALVGLGMVFELAGGRSLPGIPDWPAILSIGVSATLFVLLFVGRRRASMRVASSFFVLNSLAMGFALFVRDPYYAQFGNWMPFQANKLACVVVALLAPQLWAAFAAIAIHVTSATLVLVTVGPELRETIVFEPVGTFAYGFVAVGLALYRQRRLALEREVATARAEIVGKERLARTILALRELANTPIQTIELCTEILRVRGPSADPEVLARLQRAVQRLRELSELLARYQSGVTWDVADTSIDALAELEGSVAPPRKAESTVVGSVRAT